jgi:hypothetical protein
MRGKTPQNQVNYSKIPKSMYALEISSAKWWKMFYLEKVQKLVIAHQ